MKSMTIERTTWSMAEALRNSVLSRPPLVQRIGHLHWSLAVRSGRADDGHKDEPPRWCSDSCAYVRWPSQGLSPDDRNNDSEADKCSPCMHVDDAGELVAGVIGLQDELPIISCRQHEARRYQLEIARYCGTS